MSGGNGDAKMCVVHEVDEADLDLPLFIGLVTVFDPWCHLILVKALRGLYNVVGGVRFQMALSIPACTAGMTIKHQ